MSTVDSRTIASSAKALVEDFFSRKGDFHSNLEKASDILTRALNQIPNDPLLLTCLGAVLSDLGFYKEAAPIVTASLKYGADTDSNAVYNRGVIYYYSENRRKAVEYFKKAARLKPDPDTWRAMCDLHGS